MIINDTRFLLQYQGYQADFSDASEPEQLSSDLRLAIEEFNQSRGHRRLVAVPFNFLTGEPTGQTGVELIRV